MGKIWKILATETLVRMLSSVGTDVQEIKAIYTYTKMSIHMFIHAYVSAYVIVVKVHLETTG